IALSLLALSGLAGNKASAEEADSSKSTQLLAVTKEPLLKVPEAFPKQFVYNSGVDIAYPEDGVKGIYVTGHSAGGSRMDKLVDLLDRTALNSMVIDIKDDYGDMTTDLGSDNELIQKVTHDYFDVKKLMP